MEKPCNLLIKKWKLTYFLYLPYIPIFHIKKEKKVHFSWETFYGKKSTKIDFSPISCKMNHSILEVDTFKVFFLISIRSIINLWNVKLFRKKTKYWHFWGWKRGESCMFLKPTSVENKDLLAKMHSSVSRVFCYVMLILWSFVCGRASQLLILE